jgi:hypothetical protein
MSQRKPRQGPQVIAGERVGRFHFTPGATRQFRLVATLFSGAKRTLQTGPTIGDLWRQPWLVCPELESEVVVLRVEHRVDSSGKAEWKPIWTEFANRSQNDD